MKTLRKSYLWSLALAVAAVALIVKTKGAKCPGCQRAQLFTHLCPRCMEAWQSRH